jgi:hypothetical protein
LNYWLFNHKIDNKLTQKLQAYSFFRYLMFKTAFLQKLGNGQLRVEESLLRSEFERRGIPITLYTMKRILRRDLPISPQTFISGDMDAMHGAMRQLGIPVPEPNDYPQCLLSYLHRKIWKSTLKDIEQGFLTENISFMFVKPADRRKNFSGKVFSSYEDFWHLGNICRRQEVWCAEVVKWRSEFRVYVIDNKIVSVDNYAGDLNSKIDQTVVESALFAYRNSGEAPAAYGIDFGVLESGETALVEANDGYSLGAYTIQAQPYTDLLIRRWEELLALST